MQKEIKTNSVFQLSAIALIAFLAHSCIRPEENESKQQEKPNIILFNIDDLGWKDAGYMGSDYYDTPHIDALAKSGMIFTNAYANAPNCAPSRACLMSGQYTPRHGIYTVGDPARGHDEIRKLVPIPNKTVLDTNITTMAEALKNNGYSTIHLGKWHLGDSASVTKQGFDYNVAGYHQGGPYLGGYYSPFDYPNLAETEEGTYLTDTLTFEAIDFIRNNRKNPFFMYFAHYAVHVPIEGRKDLIKKYENKKKGTLHNHAEYGAMVESVDISVGKVLDALEKFDLRQNTIIVFISDNGGVAQFTSMKPVRGHKGTIYEGGIRVPLVISWPGMIQTGSKCNFPVIGTDFYPTFLDVTNTPDTEQTLDGVNILPLLKGKGKLNRDTLFWHFPAYLQGYHPGDNMRIRPCSAVRKVKYKLVEYFENGKLELYDLKNDIGESMNLVDSLPEIAKNLHNILKSWRQKTNAPVPTTLNPAFDPAEFNKLDETYGEDLIIKNYSL